MDVRGAAELLQEEMAPAQRHRFLTNIHTESNRIRQIVDRMPELSALETRSKISKRETISVHSMVKTVMESKRPMLSRKKITPTVSVADTIFVKGDSFLLNQAIADLVQNAIDFSEEPASIEITCRSDGKIVRFVIADTGPGMILYFIKSVPF